PEAPRVACAHSTAALSAAALSPVPVHGVAGPPHPPCGRSLPIRLDTARPGLRRRRARRPGERRYGVIVPVGLLASRSWGALGSNRLRGSRASPSVRRISLDNRFHASILDVVHASPG